MHRRERNRDDVHRRHARHRGVKKGHQPTLGPEPENGERKTPILARSVALATGHICLERWTAPFVMEWLFLSVAQVCSVCTLSPNTTNPAKPHGPFRDRAADHGSPLAVRVCVLRFCHSSTPLAHWIIHLHAPTPGRTRLPRRGRVGGGGRQSR